MSSDWKKDYSTYKKHYEDFQKEVYDFLKEIEGDHSSIHIANITQRPKSQIKSENSIASKMSSNKN
jgi:ppGpp synthetase/RelA/SpoT-type nucleotidyltranferase